MSDRNNGGPAFPRPASPEPAVDYCQEGMTLRDYFAAAALQSMAASEDELGVTRTIEERATWSFQQADAMLEARK